MNYHWARSCFYQCFPANYPFHRPDFDEPLIRSRMTRSFDAWVYSLEPMRRLGTGALGDS